MLQVLGVEVPISRGSFFDAAAFIIYGDPGVGKTHLSSCFSEKTVVLDLEQGSKALDHVMRVEGDYSWEDILKIINAFRVSKELDCICIDSLTILERKCIQAVLKNNGWKSIDEPGFGKGHTAYRAEMRRVLDALKMIREAKKTVIFIGHSVVKTSNDPTQVAHDRNEFVMDKIMHTEFNAAVDAVFYMRAKVAVMKENGKDRVYASPGRELFTADLGGSVAKNRFSHIDEIVSFPHERDQVKLTPIYRDFWKGVRKETQTSVEKKGE